MTNSCGVHGHLKGRRKTPSKQLGLCLGQKPAFKQWGQLEGGGTGDSSKGKRQECIRTMQ